MAKKSKRRNGFFAAFGRHGIFFFAVENQEQHQKPPRLKWGLNERLFWEEIWESFHCEKRVKAAAVGLKLVWEIERCKVRGFFLRKYPQYWGYDLEEFWA